MSAFSSALLFLRVIKGRHRTSIFYKGLKLNQAVTLALTLSLALVMNVHLWTSFEELRTSFNVLWTSSGIIGPVYSFYASHYFFFNLAVFMPFGLLFH